MKRTKDYMKKGIKGRTARLPWYRSIVFKLAGILMFTLLPSILIFMNLYRTFQSEMIRNVSETTFSRDQQIFANFYSKIEETELYTMDLYNRPELTLLSDMWDNYDAFERTQKIAEIQEYMQWYRLMEWYVADIKIFFLQRNLCVNQNYWAEMTSAEREEVEAYFENPENMVITNGGVNLYIGSLMQGTKREQIRFLYSLKISGYKFQQLMNQLSSDDMAECAILINGDVLMDNLSDEHRLEKMLENYREFKDEVQEKTFEFSDEGGRYFCSSVGPANHRMDILTCRSYDDVFSGSRKAIILIPVLVGANILVFILFLFYVKRYIRKPVDVLSRAFSRMRNGEREVLVDEASKDEFNNLYIGFNDMSQELEVNIKENYLAQINLQREQLKQLQAQINPHFLYNTLLFIKIRIKRGDLEGAERLAGLLSEYFRFMNRNQRDVIPLEEELRCICTYMNIQMERFSNRFDFILDTCPEKLKNIPVPRLLLQPLVENAVKYGVERIEENGRIHLFYEEEDGRVRIIIEESGVEVTQEEVDRMNERIQKPSDDEEITSTININRRIKLFYGDIYELRFEKTKSGVIRTIAELDGRKDNESMEGTGGR